MNAKTARLLTRMVVSLAFVVGRPVLAQTQSLPEIPRAKDVIIDASGNSHTGKIHSIVGTKIRISIGGTIRSFDDASVKERDGIQNADELLKIARRRFELIRDSIRNIPATADDSLWKPWETALDATHAMLTRVATDAGKIEARELIQTYPKEMIDKARGSVVAVRIIKSKVESVRRKLTESEFQGVPAACEEVAREIREKSAANPELQSDEGLQQLSRDMADLAKLTRELGSLTPPDQVDMLQLPDEMQSLKSQYQAMQKAQQLPLTPEIANWCADRVRLLQQHGESVSARRNGTETLRQTQVKLQAFVTELTTNSRAIGQDEFQRFFSDAEVQLQAARSSINATQDESLREYLKRCLAQSQSTVGRERTHCQLLVFSREADRMFMQIADLSSEDNATALKRRLQSQKQLLEEFGRSASLADGQQKDLQGCDQRLRTAIVFVDCRCIEIAAQRHDQQLDRIMRPGYPKEVLSGKPDIVRIGNEAEESLNSMNGYADGRLTKEERDRLAEVRGKMTDAQVKASEATQLLAVHEPLAAIPPVFRSLAEIAQARAALAKAESLLNGTQGIQDDSLVKFRNFTFKHIEKMRADLEGAEPRLELETLTGRLAELETGLGGAASDTFAEAWAKTEELAGLSRQMTALERRLGSAAQPAEIAGLRARAAKAGSAYEQRAERARTEARQADNWIAFGEADGLLVEPTPENELLMIQWSADHRQFDRATRNLRQFRVNHREQAWRDRADELAARLAFQNAAAAEQTRKLAEAREQYSAAASVARAPAWRVSASLAEARVRRLQHAQDAEKQNYLTVLLLAGFAAAGLLFLGAFLWRDTEASRLRQAQRQIRAAASCAGGKQWEQRDEYLRRAAELLATFAEDDPRAEQLREQWKRPRVAAGDIHAGGVKLQIPEPKDVIAEIVASGESAGDVGICLDWLETRPAADGKLQKEAFRWLIRRLTPSPTMTPDELEVTCKSLRRLRRLAPDQPRLTLCEVAACWWAGRRQDAAKVAVELKADKELLAKLSQGEFGLVLAISLMEACEFHRALGVLELVSKHKEFRPRAEQWRRIAAARLAENAASPKRPRLRLIDKLLAQTP